MWKEVLFGARDNQSDSNKNFSGPSLKDASNGLESQCSSVASGLCDLGEIISSLSLSLRALCWVLRIPMN